MANANDADAMPEPADCHGGHGSGHHHRRGLAVLLPERHHGNHNHGGEDACSVDMSDSCDTDGMDDMSGMGPDYGSHHTNPHIVFVGNPNVGKSTLFNAILGTNASVMNAPGTTVLVEQGQLHRPDGEIWDFIDTPGTASLDAISPDEQVASEAAMGRAHHPRPDVVVLTFNATSPSKSLYLMSQLMDLGLPLIVAVTMLDLAEKQHSSITVDRLAAEFPNIPFVRVDGRSGEGTDALLAVIDTMLTAVGKTQESHTSCNSTDSSAYSNAKRSHVVRVDASNTSTDANQIKVSDAYDDVPDHADTNTNVSRETCACGSHNPSNTNDSDKPRHPSATHHAASHTPNAASRAIAAINAVTNEPIPPQKASAAQVEQWVQGSSDERFEWIAAKLRDLNGGRTEIVDTETFSDKLDRILLHPAVGLIVFLVTMFLVFEATTVLAGPLQDWFDVTLRGWCTDGIAWLFTTIAGKASLDGWLYSLVVDGLLNGAITVCTFIPPMGIMFIILSLLEDSGYLARAAFVMDRAMRMIGLDGRAFLPLVVGFGCNLPALASTRTLPDSRQRLMTGLLIPFTSCSARLSVYIVLAYAFFDQYAGLAIFLMYVSSIAIILAVGFALRHTQFKDLETQPFAMELPPYQVPRMFQLLKSVVLRLWSFITGASSVIISMLIIVWFASAIPISAGAAGTNTFGHVDNVEDSVYGVVSGAIAPIFEPAGFNDWHASSAIVTGFVAKEVVVSSLSQSYQLGGGDDQSEQQQGRGSLGEHLHESFTASSHGHPEAAAAAFMIFILAYTPCLATVAEMKRQYGGKIALQSVTTGLIVAYILAVVVFQIGRLL